MTNPDRARKNSSMILRAIAERGSNAAAEGWGVSASRFCHMKNDKDHPLTECVAGMLAALGLKVVPDRMQCFDPEYVEHLRALAQLGLRQPSADQVLEWDE